MEESNLINNDNTYNTDMSTSQSIIGGNATTNNKFNKDDLQEVTGGGGGGIVTPPTTIVDGSETSQTTGTLTPILLILGDGISIDEEPVLLEEDGDTTYNAVINSEYKDRVPTINLEGGEVSYCDANYVIAVTETDENIPVSYNSTNLSVSFTNNGDNWCSVIFKSPLEVTDQLKLPLNSDNFPDNSKIIVPVISCKGNTGAERNTVITFNIKNYEINHNISLNVTQESGTQQVTAGPVILKYTGPKVSQIKEDEKTYKIIPHRTYYILKNQKSSYIYENEEDRYRDDEQFYFLCFGIADDSGDFYNKIDASGNTDLWNKYGNLITSSNPNYKLLLIFETTIKRTGTAAVMQITPDEKNTEISDEVTFSYNNKAFITVKFAHQDQRYTIFARAKLDGTSILNDCRGLYFLTNNNPINDRKYRSNGDVKLINKSIFLIENKYQIYTYNKTLQTVLNDYELEYDNSGGGYDFSSYMDYNVIDISDCINDTLGNQVYLKDIPNGDDFINFKIYIYTRKNDQYVYLGYIATSEVDDDGIQIGFYIKKT